MASINTIVKRKQYLWLGIVVVGAASAIGGALYLSDVDMAGNGEAVAEQEPVPDMTGVVDTTFDDKVRQHATTEMQVTAAQMQKQYEEIRRELDVLNKQRGDDQRRIEKLGQDNAALAEQVKALGANPVTATGEPVPQTPASPPGPEGEPQPGNTPVSFPPQGSVAVPPPTAFYPGNGVTPPPQVTYQSVPVPNRIQRKVFKVPDTANPSMPIQICPAPPPLFRRIGLAIGYWEPMALTDVTRSPGCMVNLGFSLPAFGKTAQGTAKKDEKQVNGAFYHVHWYKYPLTYWLNIITSLGCLEGGDLDIAYLSEIDPTWTDSSLTTILNPEAVIFANPIAQGACAADAIASAFNMPLDVLFWCAGSQGSMYPFNGWVSNESSPLQSSLLVSERMAFKLHRQGMIMETIGKNNAVCNEYPSPILPKERWRYQMVNMYPDSGQCHPFGRSVMRWETGKNPPNTKKNFGYLMWRKRNCVFL